MSWADKLFLGNPDGLDDFEVLSALSGDPGFVWMSAGGIAERSGFRLNFQRAFASIERLVEAGLVVPHPSQANLFGEASTVSCWSIN